MSRLIPIYNTHRMVHEYFSERYRPGIARFNRLKADGAARARDLSLWKQKIRENWAGIRILRIDAEKEGPFTVGETVKVTALINLGNLSPSDVSVELYTGGVDASGSLYDAKPLAMEWTGQKLKGQVFEGRLTLTKSGKSGYSLRVLPSHPDMFPAQDLMLIKWA